MAIKKFSTIKGEFFFDEKINLVSKPKSNDDIRDINEKEVFLALKNISENTDLKDYYNKNTELTKTRIKKSVTKDKLIIQAINNIDDIHRVINTLSKRLREWYELYNPEFSVKLTDNERFVKLITEKSKENLLKEINVTNSMGADIEKEDIEPIMNLAEHIKELFKLKNSHERYLEITLKNIAPNMTFIIGSNIAARLIEHVGSLERLTRIPASTIQLLGAEKALFRHLVTGAKCPKYGVIYNHKFVAQSKNKGKAARIIADKISIAAKVDFFKGEFIGEKLKQDLEKAMK